MSGTGGEPKGTHPRYVLTLLLVANLLNYVDRQVLYAVFPLIKRDFGISDTALGFLGSAFMVCCMVSAPIFAYWGRRASRTRLAFWGPLIWSLPTIFSGLAQGIPARLGLRFRCAAPVTAFTLLTSSVEFFVYAMFAAEFFLFLNTRPLNALIVAVTTPSLRTMAFAVNIFLIHALGDAVSPTVIG